MKNKVQRVSFCDILLDPAATGEFGSTVQRNNLRDGSFGHSIQQFVFFRRGALRPYSISTSSTPAPADEPATVPPDSFDPPDVPFASFASLVSSSLKEPALPSSTEAARPGEDARAVYVSITICRGSDIPRVPTLRTVDGTSGVMSSAEKRLTDEPTKMDPPACGVGVVSNDAAANRV
ncbi:hypothetical protein B0H14DRAFT_3517104 [Mycena olivaceomarginata]|nr:hypothetical protein B0H14DRAFT_3517104 [Mycena olivaceomarginata]